MAAILKPYSLSVWKDVLKTVTIDSVEKQYFDEELVENIGAHNMKSPYKAFDVGFVLKTDGSTDLTFTINGKVYEENTGKLIDNPFFGLLKNETKLKLHYNYTSDDNGWYDFIIKSIDATSTNHQYNITAKNLYVDELSKTGFGVTLQNSLSNNSGTIIDLGQKVVEDTDWQISQSINLIEKQKMPLFNVTLNSSITADNMTKTFNTDNTITINANSSILCFYDDINNENDSLQFLYNTTYEADDERYITNTDNYTLNVNYKTVSNRTYCYILINNVETILFYKDNISISYNYRGKKIIKTQLSEYNDYLERYVYLYDNSENPGETIYGYEDYDYITSSTVNNYITNNKDFTSSNGWTPDGGSSIETYLYPEYDGSSQSNFETWMEAVKTTYLKATLPVGNYLYNSGFYDNRFDISCLTAGEQYTLRLKYKTGAAPISTQNNLKVKISSYNLQNGVYTLLTNYFIFDNLQLSNDYYTQTVSCLNNCIKADLYNIGIFVYTDTTITDDYIYFEDIQLFKYVLDYQNNQIFPTTIPTSEAKIKYYYFTINSGQIGEDSIRYCYIGYNKKDTYIPMYNTNYSKIRVFETKESNSFNNIQSLCELFECWCKFEVDHEANGAIKLNSNYEPIKKINFQEYIGVDNFAGFKYGINLKEIKRTDVSDEIVTKLIIKDNTNSVAENGFCSIARAPSNIGRENFILNFNYFINQGFLDYSTVMNDLYGTSANDLAYLTNLGNYNKLYDEYSLKISSLEASLLELEAKQIVYSTLVSSGEQDLITYKDELYKYCGYTYDQFLNSTSYTELVEETGAENYLVKIINIQNQITGYNALLVSINSEIEDIKADIQSYKDLQETILTNKKALNLKFYIKYSKYIKEGSWNDDNYYDDELYYLDGEQTLNNSAFPKVTYTLSVNTVDALEDYKLYNFNIGDITFIEDTEFFGYTFIDNVKTPYHEKVVISEIKLNLDDPTKTTYTIKNYSNNYEDLFQRLTAATQSLEYASGSYARAASIIDNNGLINSSVLQQSILQNTIDLVNNKNNNVVWDENGITISNTGEVGDNKKLVRVTSGGIYLSKNNGINWTLGISADGINVAKLIGGSIDVSQINIVNGNVPTFRWDSIGINAYSYTVNDNNTLNYNPNQFVRFDQYGLYGYYGDSTTFKPISINEVEQNANFSVTWHGFMIKSRSGDGYIKISDNNDIQIFKTIGENDVDVINIGKFTYSNSTDYGLAIKDNSGNMVLRTTQEGHLSLLGNLYIGGLNYLESNVGIGNFIDGDNNKIFYAKDDNNNFKFVIRADGSVSMSGELNAPTGNIGGFIINNNSLSSNDGLVQLTPNSIIFKNISNQDVFNYSNGILSLKGNLNITGNSLVTGKILIYNEAKTNYIAIDGKYGQIYSSNYIENNTGFNFDSNTGTIIANNITIGNKANINSYIEFKNEVETTTAGYIISPNYSLSNLYSYGNSDANKMNKAYLVAGEIVNTTFTPNFVIRSNGEAYFKKIIIEGDNYTDNIIRGNLNVTGKLTILNPNNIDNESDNIGIIISADDAVDGTSIKSSNFIESIKGWKIDHEGNAFFNNATIRGKLSSTFFEYNKLASVGGRLLISPSIQLTQDVDDESVEGSLYYVYNIINEITINANSTSLWETVTQCAVDINGTRISNCSISIIKENDIVIKVNLSILKTDAPNGIISEDDYCLPKGTIIVSTTLTTNLIELNSQDNNGPKIIMSSNLGKVIIGNLNGTVTTNFGTLDGHGLYGENVFLEGKLYLPNAGITNEGNNNNSVRIWAGTSAANKENAAFRVTQDGSIYASKGIFSGTVRSAEIISSKIIGNFTDGVNNTNEGLAVCSGNAINFYNESNNFTYIDGIKTYYGPTISISSQNFITKNVNINIKDSSDGSIFNVITDGNDLGTYIKNRIVLNKDSNISSELTFNNNDFVLKYNNNNIIKINASNIEFLNKTISDLALIKTKLSYGNNEKIYTLISTQIINNIEEEIGYDLFII